MKRNKGLTILFYIVFLAIITAVGGVYASFRYDLLSPEDKSYSAIKTVNGFSYDEDYPPGFDESQKTVIDLATSEEDGGLNGSDPFKGFKMFITFPGIQRRNEFGYVGNMDAWGSQFNAPDDVSFIMTYPANDPEGKETIYIYIVKLTNAELNQKTIGEILPDVFRCKLEKDADTGNYVHTECKVGYSPVVYYEYANYKYKLDKKGFAVFEGEAVWKEGTYSA